MQGPSVFPSGEPGVSGDFWAMALPQPRDRAIFPQNGLVVSSVDVQSVEPVDQRTRDALQRSVQLAIEITTNSQEAAAK